MMCRSIQLVIDSNLDIGPLHTISIAVFPAEEDTIVLQSARVESYSVHLLATVGAVFLWVGFSPRPIHFLSCHLHLLFQIQHILQHRFSLHGSWGRCPPSLRGRSWESCRERPPRKEARNGLYKSVLSSYISSIATRTLSRHPQLGSPSTKKWLLMAAEDKAKPCAYLAVMVGHSPPLLC